MTDLDRNTLMNGSFVKFFEGTPQLEDWTEEMIEQSMLEFLAQRNKTEPVWIFAYGSLICNPLFKFEEKYLAELDGWKRSFCIRLIIARGSLNQPGRMLALIPGGRTGGVALKLYEQNLFSELKLVWMREMIGGVYQPVWETIRLENGKNVQAIVFAANPNHDLYETDDRVDTIVPFISTAYGILGSNLDYVVKLHEALSKLEIKDPYIQQLAGALKQENH